MRIWDPEFRRNILVFGSWKDSKIWRGLLVIGVSVAFMVFFTSFMLGIPHATNPQLCGQVCHVTFAEYEAWQRSAHAKVPCHYCHMDKPSQKIVNPVKRLILTRTDRFKKPVNAGSELSQKDMPKKRCLRCHEAGGTFAGKTIPKPENRMHLKHLGAGLQCATCHNRIAHLNAEDFEPIKRWKAGFRYKNFMTMKEGCWRCHSRNPKYLDAAVLAAVGDKQPPTKCLTCHEKRWTLKPLTGRINHATTDGIPWKDGARHGRLAQEDFNVCLGCHPRDGTAGNENNLPDCSSTCHNGITMPHNIPLWGEFFEDARGAPMWRRVHAEAADRKGLVLSADRVSDPNRSCAMCHDRLGSHKNLCDRCHHRQFDSYNKEPEGSWVNEHQPVVRRIGSIKCQSCHQFEFCVYCHTNRSKAPRGMYMAPRFDKRP